MPTKKDLNKFMMDVAKLNGKANTLLNEINQTATFHKQQFEDSNKIIDALSKLEPAAISTNASTHRANLRKIKTEIKNLIEIYYAAFAKKLASIKKSMEEKIESNIILQNPIPGLDLSEIQTNIANTKKIISDIELLIESNNKNVINIYQRIYDQSQILNVCSIGERIKDTITHAQKLTRMLSNIQLVVSSNQYVKTQQLKALEDLDNALDPIITFPKLISAEVSSPKPAQPANVENAINTLLFSSSPIFNDRCNSESSIDMDASPNESKENESKKLAKPTV